MVKDLVISYQMGKVASSTIVASIPGCMQFHSWSSEEPIMFFSARNTGSGLGRLKQYFTWKYRYWNLMKRKNKALRDGNRIKLIIGVREPVSRSVSGFFQSLMSREKGRSLESYADFFFAYCPHMMPLKWFDVELKEKFNIDVYSYDFDRNLGFTEFSTGDYDIFIYQVEKLSTLTAQVASFLGLESLSLINTNEASDKWSADIYREFRKEVPFPRSYLEMMYDSRYFNHFYGTEKREEMFRKWRLK